MDQSKLAHEDVVEFAVEEIKKQIKNGRLAPGQRLVTSELIRDLGISIGPVREALRKLAGEGLIDIRQHRGAVVKSLSRQDIVEIYELRAVIEGAAARLATDRIKEEGNEKTVRELIAQCETAFAKRSAADYNQANQAFHSTIMGMSGNQRMAQIAEHLALPIYLLRYHQLLQSSTMETSIAEHQLIADAILSGESEKAERLMRRHVRTSGAGILESLADGY
ncbi:MAG: GntR family transcriptional regulator [Lacipirellulaceae bacterium]